MSYAIKRVKNHADAYVLVNEMGEAVPCQITTSLESAVDSLPVFKVEFQAGKHGLRVIDEDE